MRFQRNAKWTVHVRTLIYVDLLTNKEQRRDEIDTRVDERPGNRVPKLPPRWFDTQRRIFQPCRATKRMGRKGRVT